MNLDEALAFLKIHPEKRYTDPVLETLRVEALDLVLSAEARLVEAARKAAASGP